MPSPLALLVLASMVAVVQLQVTNFVLKEEVEIKWPDPLCGDFNSVRFRQGTVVVTTGPATTKGSSLKIKPGTATVYFACFEPILKTNPREKYFVSSAANNFPSKKLLSAEEERRLTVKPTSFVLTSGEAGLIIRCLPSTVPGDDDACFNLASELVDSLRVSTPTIGARIVTSGVKTTSNTGAVQTSWFAKPTTPVTFTGVDSTTGKTLFSTTLGIGTVNLTIQYTRFTSLKVDTKGKLP